MVKQSGTQGNKNLVLGVIGVIVLLSLCALVVMMYGTDVGSVFN